jgi:hypothetical protein
VLHADAASAQAADRLDARAFTLGRHIFFGAGQLRPETVDGGRLLAHELAHVVQSRADTQLVPRRSPNPGSSPDTGSEEAAAEAAARRVVDPDLKSRREEALAVGPVDEDTAEILQEAGWRAGPMPVRLSSGDPTRLVVPVDATYEEIAARIGGPESVTRTDWFEPTPDRALEPTSKALRIRNPALLAETLTVQVQARLDVELSRDVRECIDTLKQYDVSETDAWALVWKALRWGDRADWRTAGGRSYFERYLDELAAVTLEEPKWYTLGITSESQSALDWLLDEAGRTAWMLRRMIRMRSSRAVTGTDDMYVGANLARGSPLGQTWVQGVPANVVVRSMLATAPTMSEALIRARNSAYMGLRIVVPSPSEGVFYVYGAWAPVDQASPESQPYAFYFPGVAAVYPDSWNDLEAVGGEQEKLIRSSVLFEALTEAQGSPAAIFGLDYDVLRQADRESRAEVLRIALGSGAETEGVHALLARVLLTSPAEEFATIERQLVERGTLSRLINTSGSGRALLGRAFTIKTLELRPLGAAALEALPDFTVGGEDDKKWWVDVQSSEVASQAVAPQEWPPEAAVKLGHEPAVGGQSPGPVQQTGLSFRQVEHYTPWYGFGAYTKVAAYSAPYHPSQLVQITRRGGETHIASAFELAMIGPITEPWTEIFLPGLMKIANLYMMYAGARGLVTGLASSAAMARAGTAAGDVALQQAASELARQTLRRFLFDVIVLGGSTAVNEYRSELMKSPFGRVLVQLADIAFVGLAVRDVYRLFSSGVLTRLVDAAGAAIRDLGTAAPQRLLEAFDSWRAFLATMRDFASRGLVRVADATGVRMAVPTNEEGFLTAFRVARAELAGQRVIAGLTTAGRPTTAAKSVLDTLKSLATDNEAFARAYSAVTRRSARLAPGEVDRFLGRVSSVLNQRSAISGKVGGLLQDAMRADDSLKALEEARRLLANETLSNEAVSVLAAKAGRGRLDVAWFNELNLDPKYLDFIARDPNASWRLLKAAAENPFDRSLQDAVDKMLRGYAGEILAQSVIKRFLPGHVAHRQVGVPGTVLDTLLEEPGRLGRMRGVEVKAWKQEIWDAIGTGLRKRRVSHQALTDTEKLGLEMLDGLTWQLSSGRAATKTQPILMVSDKVNQATLNELMLHFGRSERGLRPDVLQFSESALDDLIQRLRAGLLEAL